MCLKIRKIKTKKPNKDGFCIGWKVITKDNKSYFFDYTYRVGENIATQMEDEIQHNLNKANNENNEIYYGLHLFLTREEARGFKNSGRSEDLFWTKEKEENKIIKVFYKPEDVMSYGITDAYKSFENGGSPSVVVKKLTVKSLKHVK